MERSLDRILTTHVGSLPRPDELIAAYQANAQAAELEGRLAAAVGEVVRRQVEVGLDVVNDGEYGKAMRAAVDYGAWWSYVYERLAGFEVREGGVYGQSFGPTSSRDRADFREFYATGQAMAGGGGSGSQQATAGNRLAQMVCTGPVTYTGREMIARDIRDLKQALVGLNPREVFMTAVSPATLQILPNTHYASQEDYTWALADAIREEYRAIIEAGFVLQIDDPALVDLYDWWFSQTDDMSGYRRWAAFQVEAVNHALEGIPEDRVRFHICWGSWHGPHSTDVPLSEVVDLLVQVKAQAYSVEAGNVRHEHEWKVWRETRLPEGKLLIPGVVSHATNVLEHPELVADRILRYAECVGRERVIASTDCGLGGRIHPQLAWAKLRALRQGADLASRALWS
ncbi:MAG: cobalamin-independent methionine synthase II family protein [Chloroflexi bacterium]|nr:cobalamin-independent methionine synthase II family protein [Chloroflexota bacterium]